MKKMKENHEIFIYIQWKNLKVDINTNAYASEWANEFIR
jgi:hypothetical protein